MAQQYDERGGFREWLNQGAGKAVTIIVVLALIGVAVWAGIRQYKKRGSSAARRVAQAGQHVLYVCEGCGASGETVVSYSVAWPTECPKCSEPKAYVGFKCRGCKRIIKNTGASLVVCPHCRRQHRIQRMPGSVPPPPALD